MFKILRVYAAKSKSEKVWLISGSDNLIAAICELYNHFLEGPAFCVDRRSTFLAMTMLSLFRESQGPKSFHEVNHLAWRAWHPAMKGGNGKTIKWGSDLKLFIDPIHGGPILIADISGSETPIYRLPSDVEHWFSKNSPAKGRSITLSAKQFQRYESLTDEVKDDLFSNTDIVSIKLRSVGDVAASDITIESTSASRWLYILTDIFARLPRHSKST